jgi:hypothetical protein
MTRLTLILALLAGPVDAASCAQRTEVVERLQSAYSEQLTVGGMTKTNDAQSVMEIWASPDTGTFTVLVTHPSGISCIVAAGTDFFRVEPEIEPEGTKL